jgi:hypothetical protein
MTAGQLKIEDIVEAADLWAHRARVDAYLERLAGQAGDLHVGHGSVVDSGLMRTAAVALRDRIDAQLRKLGAIEGNAP